MSRCCRDVRVDLIGYTKALEKLVKEPNIDLVKATMASKKADECQGDAYVGKLIGAGPGIHVDPEKFHALLRCGKIKLEDFLSCVTVSTTKARELLGKELLGRCTIQVPCTPRLVVELRNENRPPDTGLALRTLGNLLADPVRAIAA